MIPSVLLSRAEVVTGGASAVYGSDAVSGVVNLLIDKKFTGYKLNGQVGFSQYGRQFHQRSSARLAAGRSAIPSTSSLAANMRRAEGRRIPARSALLVRQRPDQHQPQPPASPTSRPTIFWPASIPGPRLITASLRRRNGPTPPSAYTGKLVPTWRPIDGIGFRADGTPFKTTQGVLANNLYSQGGTNDGPGENIYFDFPIVSPTKRYNAMAYATWEATPGPDAGARPYLWP